MEGDALTISGGMGDVSWYDLPSPSLPTFGRLQPLPPPLCSNSEAYLCNLCNCIASSVRLTADQYWTCLDLVAMPRAAVYISFLHLSYLPDPFSLTIMGNYLSLFNSFLSQLVMGCVACHTCHGCVTDFRPILGNPVEVAHMISPGTVYISHTKGTYFPLARISSSIPL